MKRQVSRLLFCLSLATGLSTHAFADSRPAPFEKATMKALNPSDPAQAAIMRWHRSLLANDYPTFSQLEFHTPKSVKG
jgi:hypothetical protein